MSTETVRAALAALLNSVPTIGRVHDYERFAAREADFAAMFRPAGETIVKGWTIGRLGGVSRRALASGRTLVTSRWLLTGYRSLVDAERSEVDLDGLVDAVIAAERADPTLGGAVRGTPVEGQSGIRLAEAGPVMFAGILCHRAKLVLDVQTFEGSTSAGFLLEDAAGSGPSIVGAVVDRLKATTSVTSVFGEIVGRPVWDPEDDPVSLPAAVVVPIADLSEPNPETFGGRQRVNVSIGVVVIAPSAWTGEDGSLAAGGLEALRRSVREALLGWGDGIAGLDVPFLYAGAEPVTAATGRIAWREMFRPALFVET